MARTREERLQACRDYYQRNREKALKVAADYRAQNRDAINSAQREYYRKNKSKCDGAAKRYREANRDKIRQISRDYVNRKRATDTTYKLKMVLRDRIRKALKGGYKSGSAVRQLGCSIEHLISYLQSRFQPGMTWDNYGEWHIDHIRPLAKFDLSVPGELKEACHYSNLQPLWAADNIRKGGR